VRGAPGVGVRGEELAGCPGTAALFLLL